METIDNRRQMSGEEIKSVINNKSRRTGIEFKDIVIGKNIIFYGNINKKISSNFTAEIDIIGVDYNKVIIKLCDFKFKKLGFFNLNRNRVIRGLLKNIVKDKIEIKGNNIALNIENIKKSNPNFEGDIDHVYIRDNLLNIEGKKLKTIFKL